MQLYGYVNTNIDRIRREVNLGIVPCSVLRHWEIYSRFDAYKKMNNSIVDAVLFTAGDMHCCESSVFKIIRKMEQTV